MSEPPRTQNEIQTINNWMMLPCADGSASSGGVAFGDWILRHGGDDSLSLAEDGVARVGILGFCIDADTGAGRDECAKRLLVADDGEFHRRLVRLSGCYVVLRQVPGGGLRIYGDATHTMPVYYAKSRDGHVVAGAYEKAVAEIVGAGESRLFRAMYGGEYATDSVSAGDVTLYEGVRCLLPNHFLDMRTGAPARYFPFETLEPVTTDAEVDAIVDRTIARAKTVFKAIAARYGVAVPLTAGYDSRTVAAIARSALAEMGPEASSNRLKFYTFRLKGMAGDEFDIKVSREIASRLGLDYSLYLAEEPDEGLCDHLMRFLGDTRKWDGTFEAVYRRELGGRCKLNGSLADQIGKASIGYDLPDWTASSLYLMTKHRNVSWRTYPLIRKWRREAAHGARGYAIYDLWSWELCLGRWSSDAFSLTSAAGIREINVFNCTAVLADWCRLSRKARTAKVLHMRILGKLAPEMLGFPFNPNKRTLDFLRGIRPVLWLGAWIKFWRARFGKRVNRVQWKRHVA